MGCLAADCAGGKSEGCVWTVGDYVARDSLLCSQKIWRSWKGEYMNLGESIISLTVLALLLYYFVYQSDKSSKFIQAASSGYATDVSALMGQGKTGGALTP